MTKIKGIVSQVYGKETGGDAKKVQEQYSSQLSAHLHTIAGFSAFVSQRLESFERCLINLSPRHGYKWATIRRFSPSVCKSAGQKYWIANVITSKVYFFVFGPILKQEDTAGIFKTVPHFH